MAAMQASHPANLLGLLDGAQSCHPLEGGLGLTETEQQLSYSDRQMLENIFLPYDLG
jgi:hypothetical protein